MWVSEKGDIIRLDEWCPHSIRAALREAATRWAWADAAGRHEVLKHLNGPPVLAPLHALCDKPGKIGWTKLEVNALRAVLAGSMVIYQNCPLCGDHVGKSTDHMAWDCPATEEWRQHYGMTDALRISREIDPGVPWTEASGNQHCALALKSGNFGGEDFFEKAFAMLP